MLRRNTFQRRASTCGLISVIIAHCDVEDDNDGDGGDNDDDDDGGEYDGGECDDDDVLQQVGLIRVIIARRRLLTLSSTITKTAQIHQTLLSCPLFNKSFFFTFSPFPFPFFVMLKMSMMMIVVKMMMKTAQIHQTLLSCPLFNKRFFSIFSSQRISSGVILSVAHFR